MKNSVHDNGGFIGRVADYTAEDYYTTLESTNYAVENGVYTNVSMATGFASSTNVVFSTDGTKVYFHESGTSNGNYATLSTPSDLSTASSLTSYSVRNNISVQGLTFNPTGTMLYYVGYSGNIYISALSTAWDISTRGSETIISLGISIPTDFQFNNDGTKAYVMRSANIYVWTLSTAYDFTTRGTRIGQSLGSGDQQGFRFNSDGTKLFTLHGQDNSGARIVEFSLSTAYDINSIGAGTTHSDIGTQVSDPHGFTFSHDGTNFYVVGENNTNVYEYSFTSNVIINHNKKNSGIWSMDADYLNASLADTSLDIDTVYGTTYLRELTSFPSATFASGSGGAGIIDVTWIFDMTFSTTDTGCILDQGGVTDGTYIGMVSGGNLRLSTSGAVSGVSNETSTTTTDMSAYAGVAGQLIVTIDYQNHIQCWWNDSTNGINQIVSVDYNGNGDWAGSNAAKAGGSNGSVHAGQATSDFTGTITRYREITAYVDTSTF
jgi:DNA-binding beta-propeller fold protein YncE